MTYREDLHRRAFDTHGVITTADAAGLGVPAVELRKLALRGALEHVGYGVYRMTEVPPTPMTQYAEAVALVGEGAVVVDESVLAIHDLALVSPRTVRVASPHRVRAVLPATVDHVRRALPPDEVTDVDGVLTMTVAAALRACRGRVVPERLLRAVDEALDHRLVTADVAAALRIDLAEPAVFRRPAEQPADAPRS